MDIEGINVVCQDNETCRAVTNYIVHCINKYRLPLHIHEGDNVVCVEHDAVYTLHSGDMGPEEEYPRLQYNSFNISQIVRTITRASLRT